MNANLLTTSPSTFWWTFCDTRSFQSLVAHHLPWSLWTMESWTGIRPNPDQFVFVPIRTANLIITMHLMSRLIVLVCIASSLFESGESITNCLTMLLIVSFLRQCPLLNAINAVQTKIPTVKTIAGHMNTLIRTKTLRSTVWEKRPLLLVSNSSEQIDEQTTNLTVYLSI